MSLIIAYYKSANQLINTSHYLFFGNGNRSITNFKIPSCVIRRCWRTSQGDLTCSASTIAPLYSKCTVLEMTSKPWHYFLCFSSTFVQLSPKGFLLPTFILCNRHHIKKDLQLSCSLILNNWPTPVPHNTKFCICNTSVSPSCTHIIVSFLMALI